MTDFELEKLEERGLTKRFYEASWDTWIADTPGRADAVKKARQAWEKNLFFSGRNGTGKTHIAMCLVKEGATYRTLREIFREAREDFKREREVINFYGGRKLLILDEVGRQKFSEFETNTLFEIIDQRWNYRKQTLLIGNIRPDELANNLGTGIMDRLKPLEVVMFDWESMR